jgi:Protein of unknown function (DUF4058)
MNSPFPGMDPFLERHWGDVHHALITYIRDWLQARLPDDLRARMQERGYIESPDARRAVYYPDIRVVERPTFSPGSAVATAVASPASVEDAGNGEPPADEPIFFHLDIELVTQGYIEIIDVRSGHRVVTAIEVLGPSNKRPGEGQRLYLQKREDQHAAAVNTVEIDLLRGGKRVLMIEPELIPPSHRTEYQVCVWRGSRPNRVGVYRVSLRERLPLIEVPARRPGRPRRRNRLANRLDRRLMASAVRARLDFNVRCQELPPRGLEMGLDGGILTLKPQSRRALLVGRHSTVRYQFRLHVHAPGINVQTVERTLKGLYKASTLAFDPCELLSPMLDDNGDGLVLRGMQAKLRRQHAVGFEPDRQPAR